MEQIQDEIRLMKDQIMDLTRPVTVSRLNFETILTCGEKRFFWPFRVCICLKIHV